MSAQYDSGLYDTDDLAKAYLAGYNTAEQACELEVQVYCSKCLQVVKTSRGLRVFMQVPPRMCQHCESLLSIVVQRVAT